MWFGQRLAYPAMDTFYWVSSLVLLGCTAASLVPGRKSVLASERPPLVFALAAFAASVAFLALTSMAFDFGACVYPSRGIHSSLQDA